jgi:hypothetical protein
MTLRRHILAAMLVTCAGAGAVAGDEGTAPERFGAHWAKVGDRAQIEYILDGFRSASQGSVAERIMMRSVRAEEEMQRVAVPATTTSVSVNGMTAATGSSGATTVRFLRDDRGWRVQGTVLPAPGPVTAAGTLPGSTAGSTFIETPVSRELGIDRLTRGVTKEKLGRALFQTPGFTASYYAARYFKSAPFVSSTYIQFVVDPGWNRLLYGNMNRWIKSYGNLSGPTSIAVDAEGNVYIGEAGRQRITVLRLSGEGDAAELRPAYTITGITSPSSVAHSDNGTPLDPSDDFLYVTDASAGTLVKFRLERDGATRVWSKGGFDSPSAVAAGRWNGSNNGFVYVIDNVAKRIRLLEDEGSSASTVKEFRGAYSQYFSGVTTDHFGNVYLADVTGSRLFKMTAALDPLDDEGGEALYAGLASVDIPFGKITVEGQGTYWAGFDQLFAIERWTDQTGGRRRTLGIALKDLTFGADDDARAVTSRFLLTDFGSVSGRVFDPSGAIVRVVSDGGMVSGRKEMVWDRRDASGRQVPPGEYRFELSVSSPYREERITASTRLSLPLYYEERGGIDEPHLIHGSAVTWGLSAAAQDPDAVAYRFTGLNPAGTYAVAAEYESPDGKSRLQDMSADDGTLLHQVVAVGSGVTRTGYAAVPASTYRNGEIVIRVNRRGEGTAVVSRLILKETGTGFSAKPDEATIPTAYGLGQNYPNPFNPSTAIRFSLPASGPVSLVVYDITGKEVAELLHEERSAGIHEVRFDAGRIRGGLASGVYFYRINAGSFTQTKKMLLVK